MIKTKQLLKQEWYKSPYDIALTTLNIYKKQVNKELI